MGHIHSFSVVVIATLIFLYFDGCSSVDNQRNTFPELSSGSAPLLSDNADDDYELDDFDNDYELNDKSSVLTKLMVSSMVGVLKLHSEYDKLHHSHHKLIECPNPNVVFVMLYFNELYEGTDEVPSSSWSSYLFMDARVLIEINKIVLLYGDMEDSDGL